MAKTPTQAPQSQPGPSKSNASRIEGAFKEASSVFSILLGGMSLFALLRIALNQGFSAVFAKAFEWYDQKFLGVLFGWIPNYVIGIAEQLHLPSFSVEWHWKHLFVLIWLYIAGDVASEFERKKPITALLTFLYGSVVGLAAALTAGAYSLEDPAMIAVIVPICGFVFYQLLRSVNNAFVRPQPNSTWLQSFSHFAIRFPLSDAVLGAAVVTIALLLRAVGVTASNLLVLFLFLVSLALRNIVQSALYSRRETRAGNPTSWRTLATAKLGLRVLAIVAAALVMIALNAGM